MSYVLDKASELANAFGAKTTPHVFFFDRNLKLIYTGSIDNSFEDKRKKDIPYLMNAIDAYSNEKKIKTKSTSPKGCSIKRLKS
jgi:thioredoxin-related protein